MALVLTSTNWIRGATAPGGSSQINATVSVWLKIDGVVNSRQIFRTQFGSTRVLGLRTDASGNLVVEQARSGGNFTSSGLTIPSGWFHLLTRYSRFGSGDAVAGRWSVFVNGSEVHFTSLDATLNFGDNWQLGDSLSTMTVKVWQPAVWDTDALSNADIATLATAGKTASDIGTTPKSRWTLADQTTGNVTVSPRDSGLDDIGSNPTSHFGTRNGTPTWDADAPAPASSSGLLMRRRRAA